MLALLLVCLTVFGTGVSYHATCARCLAEAKGHESKLFGVIFGRHLDVVTPQKNQSSLPTGPDTYNQIFGRPCEHLFKRGGAGWSSWGMIACGSFPEERAFASRTHAIRALFDLFHRIDHKGHAIESYACIDGLLKADTPLKEALASSRYESGAANHHLDVFADMMDLVSTEQEWLQALSHAQSGFVGSPLFLNDVILLKSRFADHRPAVHRTASLRLMELSFPERWNHVSACLEDQDREIARAAVSYITANHRLELFGKLLRTSSEICTKEYLADSISDEDIQGLLNLDDPVIAAFCNDAITRPYRFQFLAPLITQLNRRYSEETLRAIRSLLDGPKVFSATGDPWEHIPKFSGSNSEAVDIIHLGVAPSVRDPRKWKFDDACKAIAASKDASHWILLHEAYVREVSRGVCEECAAVMAKSMSELDLKKTNDFLFNELLTSGQDNHRQSCALTAMGLQASPLLVDSIVEFQRRLPPATSDIHDQHIFQNPYYAKFLTYALHRCRGVHLQRVQLGKDGRYSLTGPHE